MRIGRWARIMMAAMPLLAGCGDFWQAPPSNGSFTLTNSGSISFSAGATSGNTVPITATPTNSFSGTVTLTCSVTAPSGASNPATCSLSPASVSLSGSTAETSTLTATTTSTTTTGAYSVTVTGTSGSTTESTTVCVAVGVSTSNCTSTAANSGNFYVLTTSSLAGYSLSSGSLTAISGSSFTLSEASAIAIAPSGNFLYVASEGSGITLYTINTSTGALTDVGIIYSDLLSGALQIDPSGKWLLDASLGGTLTAVPITSAGAEDTTRALQQVALAGSTVHQMAISPNGALISVALGSTGTESFNFTASSNTPIGSSYSPIVPKGGSFGAAIAVAFDPQSRLLYVGETAAFSGSTNSGALRAFKPVTNGLNEISGSPYAPAGIGPHAILPDSTGSYVYAASWGSGASGSIAGYSVTTSALTAVGTAVATGTEPVGIAEDSTDSYVLLVNTAGSTPLNAYTFDGATLGQLDAFTVTGSPADNPIAVVAAP